MCCCSLDGTVMFCYLIWTIYICFQDNSDLYVLYQTNIVDHGVTMVAQGPEQGPNFFGSEQGLTILELDLLHLLICYWFCIIFFVVGNCSIQYCFMGQVLSWLNYCHSVAMNVPKRGMTRDTEPSSVTPDMYCAVFRDCVPYSTIQSAKQSGCLFLCNVSNGNQIRDSNHDIIFCLFS